MLHGEFVKLFCLAITRAMGNHSRSIRLPVRAKGTGEAVVKSTKQVKTNLILH